MCPKTPYLVTLYYIQIKSKYVSDISSSNQEKIRIYSDFFSKMMKSHQTVIISRSELKVKGLLLKNYFNSIKN